MSRVVVVGAGVGGLAAAARLAHAGHEVTVCEQADQVGGKLGWWVRDGVGFDTGPSLLTLPATLRDTFEATGGWPEHLQLQALSPLARYLFPDGSSLDLPGEPDQRRAALEAWSPGSGADWQRLMTYAARVWAATSGPFLGQPLHGVRTLLGLALRRPADIALVAPGRSLAALGTHHLRDPRLRMLLWRYATYTGSDPRRAPAALVGIAYAEQQFGGWYVPGGLHTIATALAERARALGAEIRLRTDVARLEVPAGQVVAVRLASGERLAADVVVANADARHLYDDLLSAGHAPKGLHRAPRSYSGLALLAGVHGPSPELAHHTVSFPADYAAEFDALAAGRAPTDPTLYLSVPADRSVSAGGVHPWFGLVNAPRSDQCRESRSAAGFLELMAGRGFDIRGRLAFARTRTPADLERATRTPGGAIYGSSSDGARAAFLRPANRSPVSGLFLVGGSAHPGGGLPLVLLSARIVAGLVPASP